MKKLLRQFFCCVLLFHFYAVQAQEPVPDSLVRRRGDSTFRRGDSTDRRGDSTRGRRGQGMASLFADTAKLSTSDYQLQIEKTFVILDQVDNGSELGLQVTTVKNKQTETDSVLAVLKDNIINNSGALSHRNLQIFRSLLQNLQVVLKDHRATLDSAEVMLDRLRENMRPLTADTVLQQLTRDSALRLQFATQLRDMRQAFRGATRKLRRSFSELNVLQTHNSSSVITTAQLLERVDNLIDNSTSRIFGKEYNFLWEKDTATQPAQARASVTKAYRAERKAVRYYFKDSGYKRLFLLIIGVLFFIWVFRNIQILKIRNALSSLHDFHFSYLPSGYILAPLVVMFCIAPFFDLHAPSVYIESMEFLLLIILTIICWKKWPRKLFVTWMAMVVLYVLFSMSHHIMNPATWQRWALVVMNILSVYFGFQFLSKMKEYLYLKGFLRFVIILHNVMNIVAVLLNVFGRYTVAQLLGSTAIFAFMQAIGLAVFSKICIEAIMLQVATSRIKRGLSVQYDFSEMLKSFHRLLLVVIVALWLIVFITNLNISNLVFSQLTGFLSAPRHIGDATFRIGGILLFFMIIWVAHLLQRYVGYFFGDTKADEEVQNKRQRSRLLIARLMLLTFGYLLAVAASGVPVDKITIVLGALGVGIGLGLQNIVNNFVSGIILIFDRPLQIGDIVEVGDHSGRVREIGLRSSTLATAEGAEVIIPNGDILSTQIVNWTLSNTQRRLDMELEIKGSDDMELVSTAVKQSVLQSKYIAREREPQVVFTKMHDDGFTLKLFYWCADVAKSEESKNEIFLLLKKGLKANNLTLE